ncbi:MAG: ABC transporter permease [Gammaproteobacteria bacterium]
MAIVGLALGSLYNRRVTAALTVAAIAVSVMLLLGVDRIGRAARESFESTISGTDLIVGARGGPMQLLLYSVFRMGGATNEISWQSYQDLAAHPEVAWTIPIALGDSHHGYRVMGTSLDYFQHYRYGRGKPLELAAGKPFADVFDVVIGAEVADKLRYQLGDKIIVSHGVSDVGVIQHADKPFTVVGILRRTGTPVDQTVHMGLQGIEAMHVDWASGAPPAPGQGITAEQARKMSLQPKTLTAFLVGLKAKIGIFALQREVNDYTPEALMAILPGVALQELWALVGNAEVALKTISAFVVASGLIGMLTAILTSLNERRREMAILRSVGARPAHIFGLLVSEAGLLALCGCLLGTALLYVLLFLGRPFIEARLGLVLAIGLPGARELWLLILIVTTALALGLLPAWRAYRHSLADGLTIRL